MRKANRLSCATVALRRCFMYESMDLTGRWADGQILKGGERAGDVGKCGGLEARWK